ncbi:hypothetical protein Golob_007189, partial [Gossypium lobatum]|nr:hypothetical protein [Gossypium lobatum]
MHIFFSLSCMLVNVLSFKKGVF